MTKLTLDVLEIIVITGTGTDKIVINTALPEAVHPYGEVSSLVMDAAKGTGYDYAVAHFPNIPLKLIKTR